MVSTRLRKHAKRHEGEIAYDTKGMGMGFSKYVSAALVTAALLIGGTASAGTIEHLETFDDLDSWVVGKWVKSLATIEEGSPVVITTGEGKRPYSLGSRFFLDSSVTKIVVERNPEAGISGVDLLQYGPSKGLLGVTALGMDGNGLRWLVGDNQIEGATQYRVRLHLSPNTRVELSEMKAISGAPEPTGALLLAMGMTLTGVHMRGRRPR